MFPATSGHFRLDKVPELSGFSAEDSVSGETATIVTRDVMTSESDNFFSIIEHVFGMFLGKLALPQHVSNFVVVVHADLTAEVYINDFMVAVEMRTKLDVAAMTPFGKKAIADIQNIRFDPIKIDSSDQVFILLKAGWRFLLAYDLTRHCDMTANGKQIARVYRYLLFRDEYSVLENGPLFDSLMKDGWFPFTEMLSSDYKKLETAYRYKDDVGKYTAYMNDILSAFDKVRLDSLMSYWWRYEAFADKKELLSEAVDAFLAGKHISCIKILYSEIEGIVRLLYHKEIGKKPSFGDLQGFIKEKATARYTDPTSLGFPLTFIEYLDKSIFAGFDLESGEVTLSRHSAEHGVAGAELYDRERALQAILTLDQIRFYLF